MVSSRIPVICWNKELWWLYLDNKISTATECLATGRELIKKEHERLGKKICWLGSEGETKDNDQVVKLR